MKRIVLLSLSLILVIGLATTGSCKKDSKIKGCMDKDSQNYDPTAQEDNGSCTYEGQVVFWYDKAASDGLIADGATTLTFYLSTVEIGNTATTVFWTAAPTCGSNGSITAVEDLGKSKTHTYALSVKDQTGWEYWNGSVNVEGHTCTQYQLLWSAAKK
jgi:hypothetical protein